METAFIRAKAKDNVDMLDNLTAYLDAATREEVVDYVIDTFGDIEKVLAHAVQSSIDPVAAYNTFVAKFKDYWNAPPA